MLDSTAILLELSIISACNVAAVYIAAIVYELEWSSVVSVMVVASLITVWLARLVISKMGTKKIITETTLGESLTALLIALLSSIIVFIILIYRFNLPMAVGMSLLSGIVTSIIRQLLQ
jgi:hypothetical protein